MRFETQFRVPGAPADVIRRFADVPAMAGFLPGASVGAANADGSFPATLVVSFGPKRIAFKGTITNQIDMAANAGVLRGTASADMRSARMAVTMSYALSEDASAQGIGTRVSIVSDAELTGVLAEFAKTGGVPVTEALLAEFARRFAAAYETPPAAGGSPSASVGAAPAALSAPRLLWRTLCYMLSRMIRGWR